MEMKDLFLVFQDRLIGIDRAQALGNFFSGTAIFRVFELMEKGCKSGKAEPYFLYYFH
jgi:hypothetical protein